MVGPSGWMAAWAASSQQVPNGQSPEDLTEEFSGVVMATSCGPLATGVVMPACLVMT